MRERRDPKVFVFPEGVMNQVAYERLQAGETKDAVEIFKLIVEAYPASANAQDSLGDAYLAAGQNDLRSRRRAGHWRCWRPIAGTMS